MRAREAAKWLNLAYETYGLDGVGEMAEALGLPVSSEDSTTTEGSGADPALASEMLTQCPSRKPDGDSRWKRYNGDPRWFHCGYEGYLESRKPTSERRIAECFYDEQGRLVDDRHPYAECQGTPDQYDANEWGHVWPDEGGIVKRGWGAFLESQRHEADQLRDFLRHAPRRELGNVRPFRAPLPHYSRGLVR